MFRLRFAFRHRWAFRGFLIAIILTASDIGAVQIEFDYTYDENGFFDDPLRRQLLELAGRHVNRYVDQLEAIVPEGENRWFTFPPLPPGGADTSLFDMDIPENVIRVIVGGNNVLPVLTLSQTNVAPASLWTGDTQWDELLRSRGQHGALQTPATDFGNWGGVSTYNGDDIQWHFGLTTDGLDPEETDFLTVAIHELFHIFGFGPADSFQALTDLTDLTFTGSESSAVGSVNNRNLELNDGGHWVRGTVSRVGRELQEALMGPVIPPGKRMFPTELDRAALRDVGWQEALPGDVNLDGQFDMLDIVEVSQVGKYRSDEIATWSEGDWNDDFRFDQHDIVAALVSGVYLTGPYSALEAADLNDVDLIHVQVPEASSLLTITVGLFALLASAVRRKTRARSTLESLTKPPL